MEKKYFSIPVIAILGLALSGCGSTLTTSETCVEMKAITVSFPSTMPGDPAEEKKILQEVATQLDRLADKSSETLKDAVKSTAKVIKARANDKELDLGELDDQEAMYEKLQSICEL